MVKVWQAAEGITSQIEFQGLRKSGQKHKVRLTKNNYQLVAENSGQSPEVLMSNYNEALDSPARTKNRKAAHINGFVELLMGFEPMTSSLPRRRRPPNLVQNRQISANSAVELLHIVHIVHIVHGTQVVSWCTLEQKLEQNI